LICHVVCTSKEHVKRALSNEVSSRKKTFTDTLYLRRQSVLQGKKLLHRFKDQLVNAFEVELLSGKGSGTYIYHWALNG
jgi:hypothetical protein